MIQSERPLMKNRAEAPASLSVPVPGDEPTTCGYHGAQLTITRNSSADFQDRQVFLFVDDEPWGKVKYGRPLTREIPPGHHKVRAFNTLFSHTIEIDAVPGLMRQAGT